MLTSSRQRVVAVVVHRQVVVVHWQVAAVHQQVAAAAPGQAVVVRLASSGKILQIRLHLPLQVAIAFSFYPPPSKFCS
jgi:hypothetical protein